MSSSVDTGVLYNGAPMNRNMRSANMLFGDKVCGKSAVALRSIERIAGRG